MRTERLNSALLSTLLIASLIAATNPVVAEVRGVDVSISPTDQGGVGIGTTLTYTVTVSNTGTVADNYDLTASDNKNWVLSISPSSLSIAAGESDNATLSVTISSGTVCTLDGITVTATSQTDNTVNDNAIAFAHLSQATFNLEHHDEISIDLNIHLREDADNLVAKFYTWGSTFQAENVIWENMPYHLDSKEYVSHPQGKQVENVRLVLVDEAGAELATVKTFTVTKSTLIGLISMKKAMWPFADENEKREIFEQFPIILSRWPFAP